MKERKRSNRWEIAGAAMAGQQPHDVFHAVAVGIAFPFGAAVAVCLMLVVGIRRGGHPRRLPGPGYAAGRVHPHHARERRMAL
jgi:hypothetical protein